MCLVLGKGYQPVAVYPEWDSWIGFCCDAVQCWCSPPKEGMAVGLEQVRHR